MNTQAIGGVFTLNVPEILSPYSRLDDMMCLAYIQL